MAFTLEDFVELRPYAYHVSDKVNTTRLREHRRIQPTAELLQLAKLQDEIRRRRPQAIPIRIDGQQVVLKDQRPLVFANVSLGRNWSEGDLVEHLNKHVYFWPGTVDGPIGHGRRLHARYQSREPAVLRTPTTALLSANQTLEPLFCPYNSGAPRKYKGRPSPRGSDLFRPAGKFDRSPTQVVELVFRGSVELPQETEIRVDGGLWQRL